MTVEELLARGIQLFKDSGIEGARTDAEIIMAHILKVDRSWLLAHNQDELKNADIKSIQLLFNKRAQRRPLAYVIEEKEFYGLNFRIDERVLTPRVETESLVTEVIQRAPKKSHILDIGTGSGAIAIALKQARPDLILTASEHDPAALELAKENARHLLGSTDAISFVASNILDQITGKFDVIVANLPYVSSEFELMPEVMHEPKIAIVGGTGDGLALYRRLFDQLQNYLNKSALVFIESDPWQQPELIRLAAGQGLAVCFQDYFILGFKY